MGACLLCGLTSIAQNVSLQPPPQQLNEQGKTLSLPAIYRIEGEKEQLHIEKFLKRNY